VPFFFLDQLVCSKFHLKENEFVILGLNNCKRAINASLMRWDLLSMPREIKASLTLVEAKKKALVLSLQCKGVK
jgi:hypothetical protein